MITLFDFFDEKLLQTYENTMCKLQSLKQNFISATCRAFLSLYVTNLQWLYFFPFRQFLNIIRKSDELFYFKGTCAIPLTTFGTHFPTISSTHQNTHIVTNDHIPLHLPSNFRCKNKNKEIAQHAEVKGEGKLQKANVQAKKKFNATKNMQVQQRKLQNKLSVI